MVARNWFNHNWSSQNQQDQTKPDPKTTHGVKQACLQEVICNQTSHNISGCFKLVEYPEWWDHSHYPQKQNSKEISTTTIVQRKAKDEVAKKALILVVVANNGSKILNMSTLISSYAWIIDCGATHHKIFDSRQWYFHPSHQGKILDL